MIFAYNRGKYMPIYSLSSLLALFLVSMGTTAAFIGIQTLKRNPRSKSGLIMFLSCLCVFFWDFGYAWMSQCYDESFAIYPRAIGLLGIFAYLIFMLNYVAFLSDYPRRIMIPFNISYCSVSLVAFIIISQRDAIRFETNVLGYWYHSNLNMGRILQLIAMIMAIIIYYLIMHYWKKKSHLKRERSIIARFSWLGIILVVGYTIDTLIPIFFDKIMFPASCFSAFFTSILLYSISQKYNVFGASSANVAKYVFRDVTVPVLVFDTDNKLVLFNDRAPKYFDETYDSLTGLTIENLLQPYEQADNIKEQLAHESLFINEKTGNICKLNNTIVKDEFDDLLYTITFIQDTTEEQMAYEQMAESRLAADAANMAKTNFLANMSHEIRTPMNAIIGMSDIVLQSDLDDEETRSHVDDIRSAGLSLLDIINDILDISKIEAGKYDIAHEEYELPSIIHDVSNIVNVKLLESPVKLVTTVDPTIPMYVVGDIVRVRQIVMNLLSNAVKFTNVGSIKFIIGWNNNPIEPELSFTVKDTGIGIKKENLDSIFEAFNRVDTRRNRNIQGTGLGLAISKHLAELMGGNIVAESLYGVGSTFTATVKQGMKEYSPIGEEIAKALEDNRYIMRISEREVEVKKRPWAKILLVDDNRVNLAVAKGLLKPYEMQVDAVLSGADALEKVKEKDYDIVFMDHMMPDMDGIDTTRAIRALGGKYENLTIIALTANAIDAARELFAREGLQDFIAKPIDKRQLNAILDKWLTSPEVYNQVP